MARSFAKADSEYLRNTNAVVSGTPVTIACWFKANDVANNYTLVSIDSAWDQRLALMLWGAAGGDPIAASSYNGAASATALSSAGPTAGTWGHACAVFAATNDRRAYFNGANKGTNANAVNDPAQDQTNIANTDGFYYFDGPIAEVAIWNIGLTDLEVWELYMGRAPWEIQSAHLVGFWLPFGDRTDRDYSGRGNYMTPVNGPTFSGYDPPKTVRAWRSNPQYIGRRIVGREQPGGVWTVPWGKSSVGPQEASLTLAMIQQIAQQASAQGTGAMTLNAAQATSQAAAAQAQAAQSMDIIQQISQQASAQGAGATTLNITQAVLQEAAVQSAAAFSLAMNQGATPSAAAQSAAAQALALAQAITAVASSQAVADISLDALLAAVFAAEAQALAGISLGNVFDITVFSGQFVSVALTLDATLSVNTVAQATGRSTLTLVVSKGITTEAVAEAAASLSLTIQEAIAAVSSAAAIAGVAMDIIAAVQVSGVEVAIVVAPAERTFIVPAESRVFEVKAENRTFIIPAEDRTFKVN